MLGTEADFIESAKRLVEVYQTRIKRLQALVSDLELEKDDQQELRNLNNLVLVNSHQNSLIAAAPVTSAPLGPQQGNGLPKKVSALVRVAIMHNPDKITAPGVIAILRSLTSDIPRKLTGARISTELYRLAKDGEIQVLEKSPGKPSVYSTTTKFRPLRSKRVNMELKD
jgi:hypothetical protein